MRNYFSAAGVTFTLALAASVLAGCGGNARGAGETVKAAQETGEKRTVRVGLTGTIYEELWKPIAADLAGEGIQIELVQFSDFSLPNQALASGDIDLNAFQHHAFFEDDRSNNGYEISAVGDTFVIAMNLYSDKINEVTELRDGDKVAIPNDASNGGRALRLLEAAGIITLKADAGPNPTTADIESSNPEIEIKEAGAADLPALLPDVAAAPYRGRQRRGGKGGKSDAGYKRSVGTADR